MKYIKSPITGELVRKNTKVETFLLYKIIYPVVNKIGLNRPFNLLRHKTGFYDEMNNGRCNWCGARKCHW